MQDSRETLAAACQVAGIVAAALLLPGALIDMTFGTDFLEVLSQAVLAAFAVALMIAVWTGHKTG